MRFQHFLLKYTCRHQEYEIKSSDFSLHENEHLQLEFLLEDINDDKRYKVMLSPKQDIELLDFYIETHLDYTTSRGIFCNGFQSWTESRMYSKEEKLKAQRRGVKVIGEAYGDGMLYEYKNKKGVIHSWTYTYIKQPKRKVFFIGSLNDANGYTIFEHHGVENKLHIIKDCKGLAATAAAELLLMDIFTANSYEWMCFQNYFEAQLLKPINAKPAIGWTSWYYYYTNISEKIIEDNLNAFVNNKVPIEIFQIDDGWQKAVGDWLNFDKKFPNGLTGIVDKIHAQKVKAGLWLAPLACEKDSFIVREKPDWILKNKDGSFLKIGFNPMWSYWFYALDVYNEEVRAYLKKVFHTILHEWNFDLVKLDFLYGTALVARNGKSRGQVMQDAMNFLRGCVGDKMILGCGVPLSPANGTTEYCRIGPDIHLSWDFSILKWIRARERPSVLNAIHNTISRRHLSGKWFWNDPDVFILRNNKNVLSFEEKYSLLLANLLFGHLLFTSDNIAEYDEGQLYWYKSIFPLMPVQDVQVNFQDNFYTINFRIKDRYYLALLNVSDAPKMYKLPNNLFFDNVKEDLVKGDKVIEIPKHSSKCYLTVGYTPFAVAGSKGHFFSGTEIENIYLSGNKVELEWAEGVLNEVKIFLKVPTDYEVISINNSGNFKRIDKNDFSIIEVEKHKL
ncbi:MAG: alpha-galactosidase [Chitinophagales bacterium]|nr:alpha-galactosidase [Chitinophagales bacterium]